MNPTRDPSRRTERGVAVVAAIVMTLGLAAASAAASPSPVSPASSASSPPGPAVEVDAPGAFDAAVQPHLSVPADAQARYLAALDAALAAAGLPDLPPQHLLLVDRSPQVQAAFALLRTPQGGWQWLGAAPISTGQVGRFDHFRTPLGVFEHSLANPDFRAEGTYNENHIRGYGLRGMRVFDFGWVPAERGWGAGGESPMRLQMHATDPDVLAPRLGRPDSKGCVRIPASLNTWLDKFGILDADYLQAAAAGQPLWMLRADRTPAPWPGRYLVIIDSGTPVRPDWARPPPPC